MAVPPTSAERKGALRHIFRSARREHVGAIERADGEAMERALADRLSPLLAEADIVATYAALGSELDPAAVDARVSVLAFPRIGENGELAFHACAHAHLVPGYRGILEPPADAPPVLPDLVLVPLLAATLDGARLGQGRGHYDRALARLRGAGRVVAVGLAWPVQIVADLPVDVWDQRLDWLATPSALIRCGDAPVGPGDLTR